MKAKRQAQIEVPTVKIGSPRPVKKRTKKTAKVKAKAKSKAGKPAKRKDKAVRLDQVPAALAPPEIPDDTPAPRPKVKAKPQEPVQVPIQSPAPAPAPGTKPGPIPVPDRPKPPREPSPRDRELVQGATCLWMGYLGDSVDDPTGVPVCPHCGGHLITAPDEATVAKGFEDFELGTYTSVNPPARPHPGYRRFAQWLRDESVIRCFPSPEAAAEAYMQVSGIKVDATR